MNKKTKRALIVALLALPIIPSLFWLGGYDFNERGETPVLCALVTLVISGLATVATYSLSDL